MGFQFGGLICPMALAQAHCDCSWLGRCLPLGVVGEECQVWQSIQEWHSLAQARLHSEQSGVLKRRTLGQEPDHHGLARRCQSSRCPHRGRKAFLNHYILVL